MIFDSWSAVMAAARRGETLYYWAPMDHQSVALTPGKHARGYIVRARTLRIYPSGSFGRGRARTADPFTADKGHLDRFSTQHSRWGAGSAKRGRRAPKRNARGRFTRARR